MRLGNWIRSSEVGFTPTGLNLALGYQHWQVGLRFERWGLRILLIKWHYCIHWKDRYHD